VLLKGAFFMKKFLLSAFVMGSSFACASTAVLDQPDDKNSGVRAVLRNEDVVLKGGKIFAPTGSSVEKATIIPQHEFDELYANAQKGASQLAREADDTLPEGENLMMMSDPRAVSDCMKTANESSKDMCQTAYPDNPDKKAECIMSQADKNRETCVQSDNQSSHGTEVKWNLKDGLSIKK
jgi:hypothetical protein